ncbi:purine nucleoside phosphorylase YfiH [Xenorhabdus szentirmaii]|uniref:Purine nucleoside phosphorylase n=2 Tax=Xenorhabdus szentirmaii TaxID=290112 RepID=W1IV92_9GAMM|nr:MULTISPECIES: purine nucleoside phosphorylase YfiH [Xenorhabdus]MBD2793699.1 polyphenol oxidase [Xenorhabdus sp. CUL]MBD2801540.1 polyphenol oxidase [Xenorhabdus sp. M]MBD2806650.1 polyphenol oxidase [Xenorhabdus sp. ZM]MBD2826747.1 polyphenol oxidase [Xenorhabdus sp. 5]PHM31567.1 Laccase domain protein YfiH [Xenorhabdus szentirmaii DSM 16338]
MASLIFPDWPQPDNVGACSTTRMGGVSLPPYDSLNLGNHVGDKSEHVERNRSLLAEYAQLPREPVWLEQIHGTEVITLDGQAVGNYQADAAYTNTPGQVCAVMTADCLPVLLCSASGDEVAAAHAGWRGLCSGILENTVSRFNAKPEMIRAWLGPAIGPEKFEVGPEVREAFIATNFDLQQAFIPYGDKYLANIYLLAKLKLQSLGITEVFGGTACTVTEERHFFSYRRDGNSGRMATLIWLR